MAVVCMLESVSHIRESFTFDSGPIHQTVMRDGFTGINHVDESLRKEWSASGTALSVPVRDPRSSALDAVGILQGYGFEARVVGEPGGLPPNHLVLVSSSAFDGWHLVFRKLLFRMPKPRKRLSKSLN